MPFGLPDHQAILDAQTVVLNGIVYVGGGGSHRCGRSDILYELNLHTKSWNRTRMHVRDFALVAYQSQLILVGGEECSKKSTQWKPTNKIWTIVTSNSGIKLEEKLPSMSGPRYGASAVEFGTYLIVAGGKSNSGHELATVEVLSGDSWSMAQRLPLPGYYMKSAILDGQLYLLRDTDIYYTSLDSLVASCKSSASDYKLWNRLPDILYHYSSLVAFGTRLVAVGGATNNYCVGDYDTMQPTSEVHAYSPNKNSWIKVAEMPSLSQRSILIFRACTVVLDTKELMVIGGDYGHTCKFWINSPPMDKACVAKVNGMYLSS